MGYFFQIAYKRLLLLYLILTITTCKQEEIPTLSTSPVTNITSTSASSGGYITSDGGAEVTQRGLCLSESANPTISDSKTTDGDGTGQFVSTLTELTPGITYNVRAYATNSVGTAYGADLMFATLGEAPDFITQSATNISATGATLNGIVNANYLSTAVTFEYGITASYGQTITATQSPVTGNSNTNVTAEITGLSGGTTYHFRVKAVNSLGTFNGNDRSFTTSGQAPKILTYEGQTYINSDISWEGVDITRTSPTLLTFRNNSITSVNTSGYMLQAGDDDTRATNHNLNNAIITGNKLDWNGTPGDLLCHGIMAGYNLNYNIKYNYIDGPFYGIVYEAGNDNGTTDINTGGGISYNIFKNCPIPIIVEGFENVYIYNNSFYYGLITPDDYYFIRLTRSNGTNIPVPCKNVKIKNNIFYSTSNITAINIPNSEALVGFECDYNIYYWAGTSGNRPKFYIVDKEYTWDQWRALGYDAHSIILNPNFDNTTNFTPAERLNYGTDLGNEFKTGLSTSAIWLVNSSPSTTDQNGTWQVGARVVTNAD